MTTAERKERVELIKRRQKAASSSTGTKALLIQTFSEDLPWLIKQVERIAELEAENVRLNFDYAALVEREAACCPAYVTFEEYIKELERQLGAMRGAMECIQERARRMKGYASGNRPMQSATQACAWIEAEATGALAALTPQPPAQEPQWNKGAFDDGAAARIVHDAAFTDHPSVDISGLAYVQAWQAGWLDADKSLTEQAQPPAQVGDDA